MISLRWTIVATAICLTAAMPASAQEAAGTLPGGAQQLTETHGDWTVNCSVTEGARQCAFSQSLGNSETGQHVMTLELFSNASGALEGMLVTPFGLNFAKGMALSVDDAPLSSPLPFLTCIPTGCLVPVVFDADQVKRLQSGTKLMATGSSATEASDLPITLSLAGFGSAMSRAIELAL